MKKYNNVKYNKQGGVLKIDRRKGCLVFDASSSSSSSLPSSCHDVSWDLADFQRNKLKTTLDGERHYIKLIFKEGNDGEEYQEVFQLTTREGIEQLGKDLRRAKRTAVRRMTSDRRPSAPTAAAASALAARNIETPNSHWPVDDQQAAASQDPQSAVPVRSHDFDVEQPITVSHFPRDPPPSFNPDYNAGSETAGMRLEDLPTATATVAEPDIEVEATVPIVTDVILLPYEYDEDEVEDSHYHAQEEADTEEDIEISPLSERVTSVLQFWDRRSQTKPKRGDRLRDDGWPHGWYIFLYFATCAMIVYLIYGSFFGLAYWDFPGLMLVVPTAFVYVPSKLLFFVVVAMVVLITDYDYLNNSMPSNEVETLMKRYIFQRPENITLHVRCWHNESRYDSNGKKSTTQVTSFSQDYPVPLVRSGDCTEVANGDIDLHEYKLTKVKLQKSLIPDQNFLDRKKQLYEHNKHRDRNCDVTEKMDLPGFLPHMLCIAAGSEKPAMLNKDAFVVAHLLVFPALPYRLWMGYITGKVRLEIRKEITTEPIGETCVCCGHQN